ncbi:MAG: hypothetical protein M4579_000213 [Chaenotheca gracillima]|nr:MAG: hypothetical protein M4579_000213 [Chaenotheca gracillima]
MSSYLSSILTTTTSRYNSIRRTLLSDEADGDTEDDSHISRVLRAYYTEKGRPYPPWLPPDPKAPQSAPTQFVSVSGRQQPSQSPAPGRGGGLSDLWDSPQQGPPQPESLSLRRGAQSRTPFNAGRPAQGRGPDSYQSGRSQLQPPEQRPLPSQRQGSYQTTSSQQARLQAEDNNYPRPTSSSSGTSAQERLKARLLGGGRSTSPAPSPVPSPGLPPGEQRNQYERGGGRYGDGSKREQSPYMGASAPWSSTGDDPYSTGGRQGGGGGGGGRGGGQQGDGGNYGRRGPGPSQGRGLPSGPRMM